MEGTVEDADGDSDPTRLDRVQRAGQIDLDRRRREEDDGELRDLHLVPKSGRPRPHASLEPAAVDDACPTDCRGLSLRNGLRKEGKSG